MSDRQLQRLFDEIARASAGAVGDLRPDDLAPEAGGDELVAVASTAECAVEWVAVNGPRLDVGVVAGDREWRMVLEHVDGRVTSGVVFERPAPFDGVDGGRAVIVNGPSSVGKSSVMAAVLRVSSSPWVMFDELFFGEVGMPYLIWGERAPTLRPGFVAGIEALAATGNQVIMTGGSPEDFAGLRQRVPTLAVGLDCPVEVRAERQRARLDRWGGLTEGTEECHRGWSYDLRFDTSTLTAEEIAAAILGAVGRL